MEKVLGEIARFVEGEIASGDAGTIISGIGGLQEAKKGEITFIANKRYLSLLKQTRASAIIAPLDIDLSGVSKPVVKTKDPSLAFARIAALFTPFQVKHPKGIHASAVIAQTAKIGRDVAIGPYVVIQEDVEIADGTIIYPHCFLGPGAKIGRDCLFYANVSIRERVAIGNRVFIQSGAVIGSEGFGYTRGGNGYQLIPQIGTVVIEDDVEIGANVTIDRARFDKTLIGRGTKIDNLVHIAHNVVIGPDCIIVAQAGISGSTHIGREVTIAGQAGLVGHIEIGDGATLAAQAGVTKSVPAGETVSGYPARPHREARKVNACVQRLPEYIRAIQELKEKVRGLEDQLKNQLRIKNEE